MFQNQISPFSVEVASWLPFMLKASEVILEECWKISVWACREYRLLILTFLSQEPEAKMEDVGEYCRQEMGPSCPDITSTRLPDCSEKM